MSEEKKILDAAAEKAAVDNAMDGRGEGKARARKRRKVSYLTLSKIDHVDYKDVDILRRFLSERGKIWPSRHTGNTAKQQRMISRAVKRAREMALLPFVVSDLSDELLVRRPRTQLEPREGREGREGRDGRGDR
jgi:small subunit ribosomal protein S18